jgi:hypothetical protein
MKQEISLHLEKNNLGINLPFEFNTVEKHKKVLENIEKNKRKAKAKTKVGVKDIIWFIVFC